MNILVTGAAGFIGSNFVYYMLRSDPECTVTALDALTYAGDLETLEALFLDPRFTFVKADITDRDAVLGLMDEGAYDAVVNFAAESHVDRSIADPGVFLATNVLGTQVLMDAARECSVPRFHQVSTDEVYGDLPLEDTNAFFTETTPLHASSPYSASKASADLLALAYWRTYGLAVTISRCSNNYGRYQFPEKLIPLAVTNLLEGKKVPVYGDGRNVRDWLYVEDHCSAIDCIVRRGTPGEVYNVGGHNERSNLTVVEQILEVLGEPKSKIEFVKDRPGHDRRYAIDASKIARELGWEPKTTFGHGIEHTIRWYEENPQWWKHILDGTYREHEKKLLGTA